MHIQLIITQFVNTFQNKFLHFFSIKQLITVLKISKMDKCSVGEMTGDTDACHKTTYSRTIGLITIADLTNDAQELLRLRTKMPSFESNSTICLHHESILIARYESLQKHCCDPFQMHTKHMKSSLRCVNTETAKQLKVKPGQKLCPECRKKGDTKAELELSTDEDFEPPCIVSDKLNMSIVNLGCSPLKSVGERDRLGYGKRKVKQVEQAMKEKVGKVLKISSDTFTNEVEQSCSDTCGDLDSLIKLMKDKCKVSSRQKQIQLLTLAPESWSIKRISEEFGVTEYLVRRSRELKKESGILAEPHAKVGKALSSKIEELVLNFYQNDEYSRMCPGQKDFVSVKKADGSREQKQKRLLLINLKELYIDFVREHNVRIGFSTFCALRPKNCVLVDSKSAHSVCVCEQHQNVVLVLAALPEQHTLQDLMGKIVCSLTARECMLHQCEKCPGKASLKRYLEELLDRYNIDDDDVVKYKQWLHTNRTTLVDLIAPFCDFVSSVCDACEKLCSHHFIMKSQAQYLKETKATLNGETAVILLDFAENYSFVIQDAVQGHHWDNSQVTLHPFAVYYKEGDELTCFSFCAVSDCLKHDTTAVHAFLHMLLRTLKAKLPQLQRIIYFSDGAASQYKN